MPVSYALEELGESERTLITAAPFDLFEATPEAPGRAETLDEANAEDVEFAPPSKTLVVVPTPRPPTIPPTYRPASGASSGVRSVAMPVAPSSRMPSPLATIGHRPHAHPTLPPSVVVPAPMPRMVVVPAPMPTPRPSTRPRVGYVRPRTSVVAMVMCGLALSGALGAMIRLLG